MMILFLTLLFTTVISQPVNLELENKKADLGRQLSAAAQVLFMKFDGLIEEYTCKREEADCKPWKAESLFDAMLLKKVNCGLTLYIGDLSTKNLENRLPFELQCWSTTHLEGLVELNALLLYMERFGGYNMV